jgi:hypothetical protein
VATDVIGSLGHASVSPDVRQIGNAPTNVRGVIKIAFL